MNSEVQPGRQVWRHRLKTHAISAIIIAAALAAILVSLRYAPFTLEP